MEKTILEHLQEKYSYQPSEKTKRYINQFYGKTIRGTWLKASVAGNHGEYKVSIRLKESNWDTVCSCYIGKYGGCHHVQALAFTYIENPTSFEEQKISPRTSIKDMASLGTYLNGVTLDDLIDELKKEKGITQAKFAKSIGMSGRHLSAVKSAERKNRHYHELGAIKLACLWVLEKRRIKK